MARGSIDGVAESETRPTTEGTERTVRRDLVTNALLAAVVSVPSVTILPP